MADYSVTDAPNTIVAMGQLFTGNTVTIKVYKIEDGSLVNIADDTTVESPANTGIFTWPFTKMFADNHIEVGSYLVRMTNNEATPSISQDTIRILSGSGTIPSAYTVTVQCYEFDIVNSSYTVTPIPDAHIYVWNSSGTLQVSSSITNSLGNVDFNLSDGDYVIKGSKAGVAFSNINITVSGANNSGTMYGNAYQIPAPSNLTNACRVYIHCFDVDSITPLPSVTAFARIVSSDFLSDDKLHSVENETGVYDSTNGVLYWDIVSGSNVEFSIQELGFFRTVLIPETLTARLTDL